MFENFIHDTILKKAKERGYKDVKNLFYGDKSSGPISFEIIVNKAGTVFLCQTPGELLDLILLNPNLSFTT